MNQVNSPATEPAGLSEQIQNVHPHESGLKGEDQMKTSAFTEEQITYVLRQVELGTPVAEGYRKLGISEQTCGRWKRRFAGMGVVELRRLRADQRGKPPAHAARGRLDPQ